MAKLTVYFKDKMVHVGHFENGIVHIGRNEANDLAIDSLAVAPVHAVIVIQDKSATIKQLADDFPILIKGEKIKQAVLEDNDVFSLGKHDIVFNVNEAEGQTQVPPNQPSDAANKPVINRGLSLASANLQVMNGKNIGKLIPLTNSITRLGSNSSGVVLVEKRKETYFISVVVNKGKIFLNNQAINETATQLNNQDVLLIDNTSLQFFQS